MTIGDRIKKCRLSLDMTLEDVAKIVGITRQTVQKYESGVVSNIPSDKIELLAAALQTTPSELMGWEQISIDEYIERKEPTPVSESGLPSDDELVKLWLSLSPEDVQRVKDFVQGLIASRKEPPSRPD